MRVYWKRFGSRNETIDGDMRARPACGTVDAMSDRLLRDIGFVRESALPIRRFIIPM